MSSFFTAPMFSRSTTNDPTAKVELRGMAPQPLAAALDALALSEDMDRNSYVVRVLEIHVRDELRKASLISKALRGNPLLAEADGGVSA